MKTSIIQKDKMVISYRIMDAVVSHGFRQAKITRNTKFQHIE